MRNAKVMHPEITAKNYIAICTDKVYRVYCGPEREYVGAFVGYYDHNANCRELGRMIKEHKAEKVTA